jgi:hypothetical protein
VASPATTYPLGKFGAFLFQHPIERRMACENVGPIARATASPFLAKRALNDGDQSSSAFETSIAKLLRPERQEPRDVFGWIGL